MAAGIWGRNVMPGLKCFSNYRFRFWFVVVCLDTRRPGFHAVAVEAARRLSDLLEAHSECEDSHHKGASLCLGAKRNLRGLRNDISFGVGFGLCCRHVQNLTYV